MGMLSQHFKGDGVRRSGKTMRGEGLYGFAVLALLSGIFALLTLMEHWEAEEERLERDCAPATHSDQRATIHH